ncbi:MAG: hypothetical protein ACREWG_17125 [Gammaproteobacteria bacterium]
MEDSNNACEPLEDAGVDAGDVRQQASTGEHRRDPSAPGNRGLDARVPIRGVS